MTIFSAPAISATVSNESTNCFLSLRFSYPDMENRFTVEGPVHFGPTAEASAKGILVRIVDAVRAMPALEVSGIPRFTRGRYEVVTDFVEPLRVIDVRRGIAIMTPEQVSDLRRRMRIIIPVEGDLWVEHLPRIPLYLMQRVVRRYSQLCGP